MPTPPAGAKCAEHRDQEASFVCPRCGDFACPSCDFRVRREAAPMCAQCWKKRQEHVLVVTKGDRLSLATTAVGIGVLALVPFYGIIFGIAAIIAGAIARGRAKRDPQGLGATRAVVAIVLGVLGIVESAVIIALFA